MKIISHRGNTTGAKPEFENTEKYIKEALYKGYDCEVDLWVKNGELLLGNDFGEHKTSLKFLFDNRDKLWIHCKNLECIGMLDSKIFNIFFHDKDIASITSNNFIWSTVYTKNCIFMKVIDNEYEKPKVDGLVGICSDYIFKYKEKHVSI